MFQHHYIAVYRWHLRQPGHKACRLRIHFQVSRDHSDHRARNLLQVYKEFKAKGKITLFTAKFHFYYAF